MEPQPIICDFCGAAAPGWRYPAHNFEMAPGIGSHGDWAACDECAALIEAGDRDGLLRRCAESSGMLHIPSIVGELRRVHNLFFSNRMGSVEKIDNPAAEVSLGIIAEEPNDA